MIFSRINLVDVLEELKTEEAIDDEEIDEGRLIVNDGGDELPVDVVTHLKFLKCVPTYTFLDKPILDKIISIDEEMVPYFGRHSAKMFIRGIPARYGCKLLRIASAGGYAFQFDPYGGASLKTNENLGLGEGVVTNLLKNSLNWKETTNLGRPNGNRLPGVVREDRIDHIIILNEENARFAKSGRLPTYVREENYIDYHFLFTVGSKKDDYVTLAYTNLVQDQLFRLPLITDIVTEFLEVIQKESCKFEAIATDSKSSLKNLNFT
ncbi:uncharacterized protein LOC143200200 [Rhynchophorus ferrugineus]|uniref:uncharacterized protein LOC143200200 n=1 Tax=Rhynchophorus ferrugineus TaxID=354439 RepID=UPI003FCE4981